MTSGDDVSQETAVTPAGGSALDRLGKTLGKKATNHVSASTLIQKASEAKDHAEELSRLATVARAKEIHQQIEKGAVPSIALLPLPEDDNQIAKIPTFFARNPIFKPARFRAELDTTWEGGEHIETPWGSVTRYGPGLTVYDEGTLMGLVRTTWRQQQKGPRLAHRLEAVSNVADLEKLDKERLAYLLENVTSVTGSATYYEICRSIGRDVGGKSLKATRDSVKRISKQTLEIYQKNSDKFTIAQILYVMGDECSGGFVGEEAGVTAMFPPGMVQMMQVYTQINLAIWRELNDTGKSVYKFINSHDWSARDRYEIYIDKLSRYVGFPGNIHEFRRALQSTCLRLVECKWAVSATIEGTGRKNPHKLLIVRK
jgi:hypothetical protein